MFGADKIGAVAKESVVEGSSRDSLGVAMEKERYNELRLILEERRIEIMSEVHDKMRDVRKENATVPQQGVRDEAESSEADIQEDIEFALLQMKAETLKKIGDALLLLGDGTFGECYECGDEISAQRLRALPFAVRCKYCEEKRESVTQVDKTNGPSRSTVSLFLDHPN